MKPCGAHALLAGGVSAGGLCSDPPPVFTLKPLQPPQRVCHRLRHFKRVLLAEGSGGGMYETLASA